MHPAPSNITKTYPPRGPLQQYRFADSTAFDCFRCHEAKKSKLITVYGADWSKRLCNGCYGRLLSLYEIKAGTNAEDERAEALADALLAMAATEDVRQAERLFKASEQRAGRLSAETMRFIATSEFVASQLDSAPQLEWSPAVIGLCKAVELELVSRVLRPLAAVAAGSDLTADKRDKDLSRIAAYCAEPAHKPPELGSFAHFLQTVIRHPLAGLEAVPKTQQLPERLHVWHSQIDAPAENLFRMIFVIEIIAWSEIVLVISKILETERARLCVEVF